MLMLDWFISLPQPCDEVVSCTTQEPPTPSSGAAQSPPPESPFPSSPPPPHAPAAAARTREPTRGMRGVASRSTSCLDDRVRSRCRECQAWPRPPRFRYRLGMNRRATAVLAGALVLLSGCGERDPEGAATVPWPSEDARRMRPEHAPTPFTAEQIRAACPVGRRSTFRVEMPGRTPFLQTFHFTAADDEVGRGDVQHSRRRGPVPRGAHDLAQRLAGLPGPRLLAGGRDDDHGDGGDGARRVRSRASSTGWRARTPRTDGSSRRPSSPGRSPAHPSAWCVRATARSR